MLYRIGQSVIVNDPNNFYCGREAVIDDVQSFAGVAVFTVSLPTTNTGRVCFALREEFLKPGLPTLPGGYRPAARRHLISEV